MKSVKHRRSDGTCRRSVLEKYRWLFFLVFFVMLFALPSLVSAAAPELSMRPIAVCSDNSRITGSSSQEQKTSGLVRSESAPSRVCLNEAENVQNIPFRRMRALLQLLAAQLAEPTGESVERIDNEPLFVAFKNILKASLPVRAGPVC